MGICVPGEWTTTSNSENAIVARDPGLHEIVKSEMDLLREITLRAENAGALICGQDRIRPAEPTTDPGCFRDALMLQRQQLVRLRELLETIWETFG